MTDFDIDIIDPISGELVVITIHVDYQWNPPRCAKCKKFGHDCAKLQRPQHNHKPASKPAMHFQKQQTNNHNDGVWMVKDKGKFVPEVGFGSGLPPSTTSQNEQVSQNEKQVGASSSLTILTDGEKVITVKNSTSKYSNEVSSLPFKDHKSRNILQEGMTTNKFSVLENVNAELNQNEELLETQNKGKKESSSKVELVGSSSNYRSKSGKGILVGDVQPMEGSITQSNNHTEGSTISNSNTDIKQIQVYLNPCSNSADPLNRKNNLGVLQDANNTQSVLNDN